MNNAFLPAFSCWLFWVLFSSCSYKLGNPGNEIASLHLQVRNESLAPLLGPKVDRELRKKFMREGRFNLVSFSKDADVMLQVELLDYEDEAELRRSDDSLLAASLRLGASAEVRMTNHLGKTLLVEVVSSDASMALPEEKFRLPEEEMALQALAENLAAQISICLMNQSW